MNLWSRRRHVNSHIQKIVFKPQKQVYSHFCGYWITVQCNPYFFDFQHYSTVFSVFRLFFSDFRLFSSKFREFDTSKFGLYSRIIVVATTVRVYRSLKIFYFGMRRLDKIPLFAYRYLCDLIDTPTVRKNPVLNTGAYLFVTVITNF